MEFTGGIVGFLLSKCININYKKENKLKKAAITMLITTIFLLFMYFINMQLCIEFYAIITGIILGIGFGIAIK